ncbi:MAG: carboxyl-terminal processing protease [Acidobacteriaceae bacterium]|jgi:carboxyl-terminal processing protease|nr:carboxyl-terminal processing protease [Acidobacteriaceae bacterium]MEA2542048.1 carboxyl-terminal processing protease [Acidobacteriaceae bacterium]MEA3006879.1 carboxyl-terminal processing protease [Acidobacteriaceae bacterium]
MSRTFKRAVFAVSILLVALVFLGGMGPSRVRADSQHDGAYPEMEVYSEVLKKVQTDYVVDPNMTKVTVGALHGLLESLDPNSSYLTPEEYKAYKQHTNEGVAQVGLNISKRYGYATVVSVEPGSPADKQNIEDGDILEAIEGHSTREMSLVMIRLLLEGKPGTSVTFSLVRPRKAEPDKITLTRAASQAPPLGLTEYESNSILYLKPVILNKERVNEIATRLKEMKKNGNKKILLDLRDVAEGDEEQGVRLANLFLEAGTIATLSGQKYPYEAFNADTSKFITGAPLVVLVNHGTSGPGEIVAAAVLDNKRADVVGDRTFGEGSVQKTMELPDGAALILSVAKYSSPLGKKIQDEAVTPNIVVATGQDTDDQKTPKPDDQLTKALDVLKQKSA